MMEQSSLMGYLDFYLSNQDVSIGKPDPEIYTKAITQLGFNPKECLIIEDNEKGIQAANGSGAWVMEVDEVEEVNYQNIMTKILQIEDQTK